MQIGIVEDEAVWREKIEAVIRKYCEEHHIPCDIQSYGNGTEFMKKQAADLLFLDIELAEGENGFEIAEKLMDAGSRCKICFLTSHTELARFGYRVNAFRYIDKRCMEEIDEALAVFLKTEIQDRLISCRDTAGMDVKIHLSELLFIETSGRKLRYVMADGSEHVCEGLISETAGRLSKFGFYQIQRSYIVNFKYIEQVNSREVMLCGGTRVAIGRAHGKEFRKAFFNWRMQFGS